MNETRPQFDDSDAIRASAHAVESNCAHQFATAMTRGLPARCCRLCGAAPQLEPDKQCRWVVHIYWLHETWCYGGKG